MWDSLDRKTALNISAARFTMAILSNVANKTRPVGRRAFIYYTFSGWRRWGRGRFETERRDIIIYTGSSIRNALKFKATGLIEIRRKKPFITRHIIYHSIFIAASLRAHNAVFADRTLNVLNKFFFFLWKQVGAPVAVCAAITTLVAVRKCIKTDGKPTELAHRTAHRARWENDCDLLTGFGSNHPFD